MNSLQTIGLSSFPSVKPATLSMEMAELESLRVRTELMLAVRRYIQQREWTVEEAARVFHQSSPRMQNLMNGEISRFSVEDLIQLLTRVGLSVQLSVHAPTIDAV